MATKSKVDPGKPSGAPRWTYIVGAIVGVVSVAWAILSYFIPKPQPPTKPVAAAPSAPTIGAANVGVSGSGNVGVVTNTGTINVGAQPVLPAPASVTKP